MNIPADTSKLITHIPIINNTLCSKIKSVILLLYYSLASNGGYSNNPRNEKPTEKHARAKAIIDDNVILVC